MSRIEIDWNDATDPFAPAEHGNYQLQIDAFTLKESNAGAPMIAAEYSIVGDEQFAGKKVFDYMVLAGKGADFGKWRLKQLASALGLAPGAETTEFVGRTFTAELGIQPGDEQYGPKNVIKNIFA